MLSYVVYRSEAVFPAGYACDGEILRTALSRNPVEGVTGFLHREDDRYFQFLEGRPDTLDAVFRRIGRDRRHHSLTVLRRGSHDSRAFGGWSMGWVEPGARPLGQRLASVTGLAAIQAPTVIAYLEEASRRQTPPTA